MNPLTDSELSAPQDRRFSLVDGMTLIAAIAASLMVNRSFRALLPAATYRSYNLPQYFEMHLAAWLLAPTVALAVSVVLVLKPGGRERFRRPGFLAVLMVTLAWLYSLTRIAVQAAVFKIQMRKTFDDPGFWWLFGSIDETVPRAGLAVLASWLTLALLGVGRFSKNRLDRAGRVFGWCWIWLGLFNWSFELLNKFSIYRPQIYGLQ